MGLFRKSDELFEIMSKQSGREPSVSGGPGASSKETPRPPTNGFVRPFETTTGFGRSALFGRSGALGRDYFTVDGDALVVVEDGFELETSGATPRAIAIRPDTLVVTGLLATGLFVAAFLLGRTSSDTPAAPQVAASETLPEAAPEQPSAEAEQPATADEPAPATLIAPPAPAAQPAPQPAQPAPAAGPAVTTLPASAPAPEGRYELIVASTTPESARKLAEWFQQSPLSPIFGRQGLRAVASAKGRVSILGFEKTEGDVLKRVRATNDPLGGNGSFGDAYFTRVKR